MISVKLDQNNYSEIAQQTITFASNERKYEFERKTKQLLIIILTT